MNIHSASIPSAAASRRPLTLGARLAGFAACCAAALSLSVDSLSAEGGATASVTGAGAGMGVVVNGSPSWAGLIRLTSSDGATIPTYCIDVYTPTSAGVPYTEGTWGSASVTNVAKVASVLRLGYPTVDASTLSGLVGAPVTDAQAAAGTQLAIWFFSDGVAIDRSNVPEVLAVADYLVAAAGSAGEPEPSLHVTPFWAGGESGVPVGPFTVSTTASEVSVTVSSGVAVDASGAPVVSLRDGDQFFVVGAAAGEVSVTVTGTGVVSTGRVFVTTESSQRQKLIAAATVRTAVKSVSTVELTEPAPTTTEPAPTTTEPEVTVTTEPAPTTTEPEVTVTTEPAPATTEPEVTVTTEPAPTTTEPEVAVAPAPTVPSMATSTPIPVAPTAPVIASPQRPTTPVFVPVSLPATGTASDMLAAIAGALLMSGVLVLAAVRRRSA